MASPARLQSFTLDGKTLDATPLQSGDIELSGYAVVWDGLDAQGENFIRGSFREAIPQFLAGSSPLAVDHDNGRVIGKVLSLEEDDRGVKLRARVDAAIRNHPTLGVYYEMVRRGTLRGLSAGGYFGRTKTAIGEMIGKVLRLTEVSVTAVPSHPLAGLQLAEVKSLHGRSPLDRLAEEMDLIGVRLAARGIALERNAAEVAARRAFVGML